jgi:hypothetical protein
MTDTIQPAAVAVEVAVVLTADRAAMRAFHRLWRTASPAVQERIRGDLAPAVLTKHHMRVAWRAATPEVRGEARRLVSDAIETDVDFKLVYDRLPSSVRRAHEKTVRERPVGRKHRPDGRRKPSGFTAPRHLSVELCAFLGVAVGIELSGSEVTHRISEYIKAHGLKGVERGINLNAPLQALLQVPDSEKLTWFNIQHYLKAHLSRGSVAVPVAAA